MFLYIDSWIVIFLVFLLFTCYLLVLRVNSYLWASILNGWIGITIIFSSNVFQESFLNFSCHNGVHHQAKLYEGSIRVWYVDNQISSTRKGRVEVIRWFVPCEHREYESNTFQEQSQWVKQFTETLLHRNQQATRV